MKKEYIVKLILIVAVLFQGAAHCLAQNAHGFTDLVYDKASKSFLGISRTSLEYTAALYYDPAVVGTMYDEKRRINSDTFSLMTTDFTATAMTRSDSPALENRLFGTYSDHFLITYFGLQSKVYESEAENVNPDNALNMKRMWYDPLNFSRFGGAQDLGWHVYRASKHGGMLKDSQSHLLGTTNRGALVKAAGK